MITGEGIDVAHWQRYRVDQLAALRAAVTGGYVWVKVYDADPDRPIDLSAVPILRDAGFKIGGYGFIRNVIAQKQAEEFMAALAQADAHDIKPMIDLEPTTAGRWGFTNDMTGAALASATGRYIHQVMQWNDYDPITYSNESFMKAMRVNEWGFPVKPLVANYSRVPSIFHIGHQYTDEAILPGVVDAYGMPRNIDRDRVSIDITARKGTPMAWRVAKSLNKLLDQLNAMAPNRDKRSDGSIGDTSHQNRNSDHNPWYGPGIVTARDFTHDPEGGLDCHWLAGQLARLRDWRIKYIIWDRRIWNPAQGWKPYHGVNPHTSHLHLSVVASPACDDTSAWNLGTAGGGGGTPGVPEPKPLARDLETEMADLFATEGEFTSRTFVVPSGMYFGVIGVGYEDIQLTHIKGIKGGGEQVTIKGTETIPAAKPYSFAIPTGVLTVEVAYAIDGAQHHAGFGFRVTL